MKIAILSGSPHKSGTTSRLIDRFSDGAKAAGHSIERFDIAFMDIHPCTACDACHRDDNSVCVFQDDMTGIAKGLAEADCVVFATPIYYFGMNGQLKTVIDRFYAIEQMIRKGQKAMLITAMSDNSEATIAPTNETYRSIVKWLEWDNVGILNAYGCETPNDLKGTDYEANAYELGRGL